MQDQTGKPQPKTAPVQGRVSYETYSWLLEHVTKEKRSIGFYVAEAVEEYVAKRKSTPHQA